MKNFKKICFSLLVVFLLVFSVPSILPFSDDSISVEAATKPKLNKKTATLIKGQTLTLKVSGTKTKVKWSSSNKKVANVNSKGKIVAKSKGVCNITAKVGKNTLFTYVAIVFYKNNTPIGYNANYADTKFIGASDELKFYFPKDVNNNTIIPDSYKLYVNCSMSN